MNARDRKEQDVVLCQMSGRLGIEFQLKLGILTACSGNSLEWISASLRPLQ